MTIDVQVDATLLRDEVPYVATIANMSFPQRTMTPEMAAKVLGESLQLIEEKTGSGPVVKIRAFDKRSGLDLFVYDIGRSVVAG